MRRFMAGGLARKPVAIHSDRRTSFCVHPWVVGQIEVGSFFLFVLLMLMLSQNRCKESMSMSKTKTEYFKLSHAPSLAPLVPIIIVRCGKWRLSASARR